MALSECLSNINDHGLELVAHGNAAFPAACYHDDLTNFEVQWHWHQELELILLAEGESVIAAGSQKYVVKEGDGVFINAEVLHAGFLSDTKECRYHSLVFHPSLIGGSFDSIFWNRYLHPLIGNKNLEGLYLSKHSSWQKEVLDMAEHCWHCFANETPGYEFTVREALSKLIFAVCSNIPAEKNSPSPKSLRDGERMKLMMQYISDHYAEEITIANLAECAMISESECLRCFHHTIQSTPIQYVKQFRIHKAASLLNSTNLKITDIGTKCGFQEMSYFSKCFKRIYGCTPSHYRLQNN